MIPFRPPPSWYKDYWLDPNYEAKAVKLLNWIPRLCVYLSKKLTIVRKRGVSYVRRRCAELPPSSSRGQHQIQK